MLDDGSTDSTGRILDGIDGVIVTHGEPHLPEHSDMVHYAKRHKLIREAGKDMDFVLCMDADLHISSDYMEQMIKRMRLDGVVKRSRRPVACGQDTKMPAKQPHAPGMVIGMKWLNMRSKLPVCSLVALAAESVLDGYPSAVYIVVPLQHKRPFGVCYIRKEVLKKRGKLLRMRRLSIFFMLWYFIRSRNWYGFWGYISYKGDKLSKQHGKYTNRLAMSWIERELGLKQDMLLETDLGLFVLPKGYTKISSSK